MYSKSSHQNSGDLTWINLWHISPHLQVRRPWRTPSRRNMRHPWHWPPLRSLPSSRRTPATSTPPAPLSTQRNQPRHREYRTKGLTLTIIKNKQLRGLPQHHRHHCQHRGISLIIENTELRGLPQHHRHHCQHRGISLVIENTELRGLPWLS